MRIILLTHFRVMTKRSSFPRFLLSDGRNTAPAHPIYLALLMGH